MESSGRYYNAGETTDRTFHCVAVKMTTIRRNIDASSPPCPNLTCSYVFSLLFGNIYVYFEFQGEVVIQAHTRTTVFLVLSSVCGAGTLLLIFLRSKVPVLADDMLTQGSQR